MEFELILPVQRNEHGHGDQRASVPGQARAAPHFAPGMACHHVLKLPGEVCASIECLVCIGLAQNGAPCQQPGLNACGLLHAALVQEIHQRHGEGTRLLIVGQVRCIQLHIARTGYALGNFTA